MSLDPVRRAVVIDIAYEIGGVGILAFVKFLAALREADWKTAAAELKNSKLFTQVPVREQRNIDILISGKFPGPVASGQDLTKLNEGLTLTAKPDAKGKWEYGYGHDIAAPEEGCPPPVCSEDFAEVIFVQDYSVAETRAIGAIGPTYW